MTKAEFDGTIEALDQFVQNCEDIEDELTERETEILNACRKTLETMNAAHARLAESGCLPWDFHVTG